MEKRVIKTVGILIAIVLVLLVAYQDLPWITNSVNMISKETKREIPIITNATVSQTQKLVNVTNHVTSSVVIPVPKVEIQQVPQTLSQQNPENLQTTSNTSQTQTSTNNYSHDELMNYALQLINSDRQTAGLPPVKLSNNQAAQIHAEDMLKAGTLSHYMTDGEKPYMVYTRFGGLGDVSQNVAWHGYGNIQGCMNGTYICDPLDTKKEIERSEYSMMYNDSSHNWGHRDNILNKHHTDVSIGIAFDKYSFYMAQNFEDNYIDYAVPISEKNGTVTFSGNLKSGSLYNIGIYYDPLPTSSTYQQHKNDSFYKIGDRIVIVRPPPQVGKYYPPSNNTMEDTDLWIQQDNHVNVAFDISPFVTQPGVYTIVAFLDNNIDTYPVTSYSITKTVPMVQDGFKSSKVHYACTTIQLEQYDQLQYQHDSLNNQYDVLEKQYTPLKTQYDSLKNQYDSMSKTATSDQEYQRDIQMYNQLESLRNQLNSIVNQINSLSNGTNSLQNQLGNFRC